MFTYDRHYNTVNDVDVNDNNDDEEDEEAMKNLYI